MIEDVKEKSLAEEAAQNLGMEIDDVQSVMDEVMLLLHKGIVESHQERGPFIPMKLLWRIGDQAFYHLLGFLDNFSEDYRWEKGDATQYLQRLGPKSS